MAIYLPVAANDTLATLGAGGLVPLKSSDIAIESENLEISVHQIKVRYLFRTNTDHDIDAIVAFPLPELDGGLVYNEPVVFPSKDPVNFVDFKVEANDALVTAKVEIRAFANDLDITAYLASLGLPASVLEPLNSALMKLSSEQRSQLEKKGLDCAGLLPSAAGCRQEGLVGRVDNANAVLLDTAFSSQRQNRACSDLSSSCGRQLCNDRQ